MIFADTPISEALGGLLVHRERAGGRLLDKGHKLSEADIAALRESGVTSVTIVRLEAGDVGEDEAAARVADAVTGAAIDKGRAFTGRVNLHAAVKGLLVVDQARIDALNRIDESITVATVPQYAVVEPEQMVATIKIVPYAAPKRAVEAAVKLAGEGGPLIRVAPVKAPAGLLLQTTLPGTKESVLNKTTQAIRHRLEALDGRLIGERRLPHDVKELAEQIAEARTAGGNILLIIGASAIADRRDVIPAAIEKAGGTVEHYGMPVDPGNLLLLARAADGTPILGLPGCARSPKLNGFDWVLQRLAAGIPVTGRDIQGMGVGGLLVDIPSRPLPRAAAVESVAKAQAPRIAALVLAAGRSSRMGADNKLLAEVGGKPLVVRTVEAVLASKARPVVVVLGHMAEQVRAVLSGLPVRFATNPDYVEGLSTSLRSGLDTLPKDVDGALIALGDMPRVSSGEIDRLIAAFNPLEGRAIIVPTVGGKRGNPVLWAKAFFPEMRQVTGDMGARRLIADYAETVCEVAMAEDGVLVDIDEPEALAALRARIKDGVAGV